MRNKSYSIVCEATSSYVENFFSQNPDTELQHVLEIAKKRGTPPLQLTPFDARHLEVLARAFSPRKILEIGTLCGYSAICLSRALQEGGML